MPPAPPARSRWSGAAGPSSPGRPARRPGRPGRGRRGQRGDGDEGGGGHERQEVVGAPPGEAPLDGGEEHPPHRDHPPERGEGQRGQACCSRPGLWSCRWWPSCRSSSPRCRRAGRTRRRPRSGPARGRCLPLPAAVSTAISTVAARRGRGRLKASRPSSSTATSRGRPRQMPRPTKTAAKTGARAVPSPSRAFRISTARSIAAGKKAAAKVLRDGTVRPKPAPRLAVASSSRP